MSFSIGNSIGIPFFNTIETGSETSSLELLNFDGIDDYISFSSHPNLINATISFYTYFDISKITENTISLVDNTLYGNSIYISIITDGISASMVVDTAVSSINYTYDLSSYDLTQTEIIIIKNNEFISSVSANGYTLTALEVEGGLFTTGDYIGYNPTTDTYGSGVLFWDLRTVNGTESHKYLGTPDGNLDSAWVDTIGSIDGTVNGSPDIIYIDGSYQVFSFDVTVGSESISIPTEVGYTYAGNIDYGDGTKLTFSSYDDVNFTHTYLAGTYTIKITGIFEAINVNNGTFASKIVSLNQFGTVGLTFINFYGCSNITSNIPIIPSTLTSLSDNVFRNCSNIIGGIVIPDTIISIGTYAFYGCSNIVGILTLSSSLTSLGSYTFYNSGFTGNLIIPEGITSIGNRCFAGCSGFNGTLTLPSTLTSISTYGFSGCSNLIGNLSLPSGMTSLSLGAFKDCSGFTGNLVIPNGITTLNNYTFQSCSGFNGTLTLPSGLTTTGSNVFSSCSNLTGTLTLPSTLTTIGFWCFSNCSGFTGTLTIPASVTTIDTAAFTWCTGLTGNLIIPDTVTTLNASAFYECTGFNGTLTLPSGLTSIQGNLVKGCTGLTGTINIPLGVTAIGDYAFKDIPNITLVNLYPSTAPTIGTQALLLGGTARPLHVPTSNSGYDVSPWTDTGIFSTITADL